MAVLSTADRARIWRALQRYWSNLREAVDLSKAELLAAVDATDGWIDDNQGAYNTALPSAAQSGLTAAQKTLLFCAVALLRVDPGVAALLRRALGVDTEA
jgi:hypothetical protein